MKAPQMKQHQKKSAQFLIVGFAAVVLVISASTSFGFFYNYFGALIPPELFGQTTAAIISGVVGVTLFDVACAVWLYTFLHNAETPEQRAICLLMTTATFLGAAAASVAHLALSASGGQFLEGLAAQDNIGLIALVVVILGVVADFGATLAYQRFSYENKQAVRESDRMDRIMQAEDEQAAELDELVAQKVKTKLTEVADHLSELQANRLAAQFQRHEGNKYGSSNTHKPQGPPRRQPRAQVAAERRNGANGLAPRDRENFT